MLQVIRIIIRCFYLVKILTPILRKLLTASKRYPFRDRLKSMAYRSKAVDLFETQPGVRREPGSENKGSDPVDSKTSFYEICLETS